jgi:hypothetical protein
MRAHERDPRPARTASRRPDRGRRGVRGRHPGDRRCGEPLDPVFGLLKAHKAAWAHLLETEDLTDDHESLEQAGRAVDVALNEITTTPPTTVAGMRAVMEYLVELDGHSDYLPMLLRSSILRSLVLAA